MIRGIGIDVVEIARIDKLIGEYGNHFLFKIFTMAEIEYCSKKAHPAIHFAGRWAAKEAFYKALPRSFQSHAMWKDIEILPDGTSGKPEMRVLSSKLVDGFQEQSISSFQLSLSHERSLCAAVVVLE